MRKFILFIYCITIPVLSYSQVQKYTPKVKFAIETYAFLKGQSTALEMVSLQFPKLRPDLTAIAKKTVLFERAQRNIEDFLKDELSDADFNIIENRINFLLKEQFRNPIEKEKYAQDFLDKVKERALFLGDTLVAKGIISFAYQDAPHQEITDGHVATYTTKGNPKAEQETLKIPVPKSWLAEEAEMPETVQQFTSHFGNGNEKILLVIYDLPEENFVLNAKSITEMIPPQTKLIRTETLKIDEKPAIMVEVEETVNQDKTKIRMLQFMFTQKQKLYCLQGSIGPFDIKKNLQPEIKKYEPLFRLIAAGTQID
ncbi:hypothetical protein B0A79_15445 [Flavobacterium piscis]|uniref:Uncharacterized protein n=1 Tax=Flavobacterium piscis TaxID=1114874 RepID=A0ABX2XUE7_9FLAO|nr:hypothetical protein [Flavobacterium piscis]OCB78201.1 hypothetical protein FLP_00400 [Flavobacterium piscis]OXG02344.1 hypothetical protein B0A79_15445 [Flavobacterium piscis]